MVLFVRAVTRKRSEIVRTKYARPITFKVSEFERAVRRESQTSAI